MKFVILVFVVSILTLILSCNSKEMNYNSTIEIINQFSDLQTIIESEKDKLLVVNFWATTCPPCLKEMPHFNRLESEYGGRNVRILLVSLDRTKDLESRVYPFVSKHQIIPEVLVLKDQNYSVWTEKIDSSWYGALPATAIYSEKGKGFRFGIYESYEDLQSDVDKFHE